VELKASAEIQSDLDGEITVPARKLHDICRSLPEESKVTFQVDGDRAIVKAARSRFSLTTLPATEFPSLNAEEQAGSFSLPASVLSEALSRTSFSMAQQDVRYYLNGVMIELRENGIRCVATDGHRLALHDAIVPGQSGNGSQVIIPRKGVQELLRVLPDSDELAKVDLTDNHIRVSLPEVRFTSKLVDGRFPDYMRVIPQNNDKDVLLPRESLRAALARAAILSNEKYKGIRLLLSDGSLQIQTHNPEQEEAQDELSIDYHGDALEIGFNVAYLLDVLNTLQSENVCMSLRDSNSSCLVTEADSKASQYVVMPMRL
jgi:DNA polymerase-3 subunit beta